MNFGNDRIIKLGREDFVKRDRCPYCGSYSREHIGLVQLARYFVFPVGRVFLDAAVRRDRTLVKCTFCGLLYHSLVPTKMTLDFLYSSPDILDFWGWQLEKRDFESKFRYIKSFLHHIKGTVRVLDIGCHTGGFLSLLPDDWEKHGVDPSPIALAKAWEVVPNGNFMEGFIEEVDLPHRYFHLITMWDVIEHLYDISSVISKVVTSLAKGGILAIETGNYKSPCARLFGPSWYYVNLLEHLICFDPKSITYMLSENGLQVQHISATVHTKPTSFAEWLSRQSQSFVYALLTAGGRFAVPWRMASSLLGRAGSPPMPVMPDHMFVIATKRR